ncbi:outer membrane beta-barrel protein [Pseudochryseolinea flava]|uniref:Outer membrane protein beta-barrel domain-containing protein n=1 Tax=Pseudochryseolinea flava TaxID=2059302 RepID=A0A364Y5G4_9BACT|nr:outer membrane beta-barrel protein [Pseudochryseolinea flava]RAW01601.1 hypothetical protein DQQ10_08050 [Pseudochryseolinea flava]
MRKIFLIVVLAICCLPAFAQGTLGKGGKQINAGLGFSSWGVPIYVGMDFGVHEDISVGPKISYRKYSDNYGFGDYSQTLVVVAVQGNYHFNRLLKLPEQWNVYAGLSLGYYTWSDVKWDGGSYDFGGEASGIGFDVQVGARYFFNENFGVNLELGGGTGSGGNVGITYKLQ